MEFHNVLLNYLTIVNWDLFPKITEKKIMKKKLSYSYTHVTHVNQAVRPSYANRHKP